MTEYERNELIRFIESITFNTPKDGKPSWIKHAIDMIKEVIINKIDDIYNEKEMIEIELHRKSYKELQQTVTDLSLENYLLKNKIEGMKWIPVEERLPETKDGYASVYVLVVDKSLLESEKPYPYELAEYYPQDFYVYNEATGKDMLIAKQGFKSANDMFSTIFHLQPVAWMYIPEYKGKTE